MGGEERDGAQLEGGGGFLRLVAQDFLVRQTRVVIDGIGQVGVPGPCPFVPSSLGPAEDAVSAAVRDCVRAFDVHVDQVPGVVVLLPLRCGLAHMQPGALVQARQPGHPVPAQDLADSGTGQMQPAALPRLEPHPKAETPQVTLSFSELKYLFECPYQFKLRFMYGFNAPIHEALGYGKGLHDALAEMHKRAIDGQIAAHDDVEDLVHRHLHTPYAYPALRDALVSSAKDALSRYIDIHGDDLERTIHSEKQIQVHITPGITVDGRIDLVKRLETDEVSIVDFKSTERAQDEDVTRDQLHVYAVGYAELTGKGADLVEGVCQINGGSGLACG